jgi:hypothetical protein
VEAIYEAFLTKHFGMAATVLLCLITEIQAFFRFQDANVNSRVFSMWNTMMSLFEVAELYAWRYRALLQDKAILSTENN